MKDCTHVPFSSVEQLSQKDVKKGRVQQRLHGAIVHGYGRLFYMVDPELVTKGENQGEQMGIKPILNTNLT